MLLDHGANVAAKDSDGSTPLHNAAGLNADSAAIDLLLDRGADIAAKDHGGLTPLHLAARNNGVAVIETLLDRGADIEARENMGRMPLHFAASYNDDPEVAELLLDRGADIDAVGSGGWTPLHWCLLHRALLVLDNQDIFNLLLSRGANASARTDTGTTPLHLTGVWGTDVWGTDERVDVPEYQEIINSLVQHGADINAKDIEGRTFLHSVVEDILKHLAERTDRYDSNRMELHDIAYFLLNCGTDIHARTDSEKTAADLLSESLNSILERAQEHEWIDALELKDELSATLNLLQHGLLFSQRFWFSNPSVEQVRTEVRRV